MIRIWLAGVASVAAIAALKTFLILQLAMPNAQASLTLTSGLFALFFTLTAAVAYVTFRQIRAYMDRQRKVKLAPGVGEPVAKETVILRNASDWGLSQAEADVAIFVVKGFSNSEIAQMRGCAIATVKSQLGQIYKKSGLDSRYQLIGFVTDEVCAMAAKNDSGPEQFVTRKVLPLSGRARAAA